MPVKPRTLTTGVDNPRRATTAATKEPERPSYYKWYGRAQWQRLRHLHLAGEPLCRRCKSKGRVTPARAVDHITPHDGDWSLFCDPDNLRSLCLPCHNRVRKEQNKLRRRR